MTRLDLENELANKADVQDVSNAITEVMMNNDIKKDLEAVKNQLG